MGHYSALSVYNKLMLYQQDLKPVWTYGIQFWGGTYQSNRNIIQRFQNRVLRGIVDDPWYIRNDNLHKDLDVAKQKLFMLAIIRIYELYLYLFLHSL
jgi:hypothetical protein